MQRAGERSAVAARDGSVDWTWQSSDVTRWRCTVPGAPLTCSNFIFQCASQEPYQLASPTADSPCGLLCPTAIGHFVPGHFHRCGRRGAGEGTSPQDSGKIRAETTPSGGRVLTASDLSVYYNMRFGAL